jgi:hypothetical protein
LRVVSPLQNGTAMNKLLCSECAQMVDAQPKVNFLGFPKFHCPACSREAKHPLSTARLVVYWVLALAAIAWSLSIVASGGIPMFGVLPALIIAALVIDFPVRSHFNKARRRSEALR